MSGLGAGVVVVVVGIVVVVDVVVVLNDVEVITDVAVFPGSVPIKFILIFPRLS